MMKMFPGTRHVNPILSGTTRHCHLTNDEPENTLRQVEDALEQANDRIERSFKNGEDGGKDAFDDLQQ